MRKHTQIRIASAAMATLLAATQIAMPFPAIAADEDYVYCAAALSWAEYWEQEGVFLSDDANGDWAAASADSDTRGESDLGAYDTVTRATSNHGLHRGSYQCTVKVYDTDGNAYDYTGKGNGESVDVVKGDNGTMITVDGKEVGTYAPKIIQMNIDPAKIGEVVGQRGKTINAIIEKTGVKIDITDEGSVSICGVDADSMEQARKMIATIVTDFEAGMVLEGDVVSIKEFGAFIEFAPGKEGMVHISKIAKQRIDHVEDVLSIGDHVKVVCLGKDKMGRLSFSIKDVAE